MAPRSGIDVEFTGDESKLMRAYDKLIKKQDEQISSLKKAKTEATSTGKAQEQTFGTKAVTQLKSYAAGVIGISTAIGAARAAAAHYRKEIDSAMAATDRITNARRRLVQVATSAQDLTKLERRADTAASKFGVSRDVARQVLFSARSEGFESDYESVVGLTSVVDPMSAAGVAGQGPALFDRRISPREAINATFATATASRLDFEQMAQALPQAAAGAALNETSAAETFASLGVVAGRTKSGETAATLISNFASKAALDERLQGQGIIEAVRRVQAMPEGERSKFLGESKELNTAFTVLSKDLQKIEAQLRVVSNAIEATGSESSLINQKVRMGLGIKATRGQLGAAGEAAAVEAALESEMASEGFSREEARRRATRAMIDAGMPSTSRWMGEALGGTAGALGASPDTVGKATLAGGTLGDLKFYNLIGMGANVASGGAPVPESHVDALDKYIEAVKENTEAMRQQNAQQAGQTLSEPDADR